MGYCDFNPRLFKPFTSMKTKIKPAMADDWEMVPATYRSTSGFSLRSKKLNQEVADIELYRFLQFTKKENLTIEGLKLKGNFIVGNDRSVYSEETYNKWKNKWETRTETLIDKKDYKPGHKYLTPCGAEVIFLGAKYISNIKNRKDNDYSIISKVTKKFFIESSYYGAEILAQKFTKDLGFVLTKEQIDKKFVTYLNRRPEITCFQDHKPKVEEYELREIAMPNREVGYTENPLIVRCDDGVFYANSSEYNFGVDCKYFGAQDRVTEVIDKNKFSRSGDYRDEERRIRDEAHLYGHNIYEGNAIFNPHHLTLSRNPLERGYYNSGRKRLHVDKFFIICVKPS